MSNSNLTPNEIFEELMVMTSQQASELSFITSQYTLRFLYATKAPGAGTDKPISLIYDSLAALNESEIIALAKNINYGDSEHSFGWCPGSPEGK